jgi:hypothetical protein
MMIQIHLSLMAIIRTKKSLFHNAFTLKTCKQRICHDNESRIIEFYNRLLLSRQLKRLKEYAVDILSNQGYSIPYHCQDITT